MVYQRNFIFLIGLLVSLVIARHMLLTFAPHIVFSGYLFMFVIGWTVAFIATQNFQIALLVGLTLVYGRVIYRYSQTKAVLDNYTGWQNTTIFIIGIVAAYGVAVLAHPYANDSWMHGVLFVMVLYLSASVIEWVLHRMIMHCYMYWPWLDKKNTNSWFLRQLQKSCHLHKDHHVSVKPDMSLKEVKDDHELIFDWPTTLGIALIGYPFILLITHVAGIRVGWWIQFVAIILMAVLFSLVWNSIHATLHGAKVDIPLREGAPNLNIKMDKDEALYARNHVIHHQIKGDQKGNYNVVFLGADELFQTNRLNS